MPMESLVIDGDAGECNAHQLYICDESDDMGRTNVGGYDNASFRANLIYIA